MRKDKILFALSLSLMLPSCGYRVGRGELIERYSSVCIPYVEGDDEGLLTTALIRATTKSGTLAYRSYGSDLMLKVCLLPPLDTNIGFSYAPDDTEDDNFSDIVVSNEARLTMMATFTLVDRRTGICILGPCEITSSLTYDFEPDLSNVNFHAFSLGQLEMHALALDAATPSLYRILAEKIVDHVNHCW
ncbi:MAG: lipopolysaccharide-assembly family protein [Chlamydiales bacterium]|nr:lipopolysaccharide-assembly family protein [Chlamydiales bacterium]